MVARQRVPNEYLRWEARSTRFCLEFAKALRWDARTPNVDQAPNLAEFQEAWRKGPVEPNLSSTRNQS
jgi:hypothetical protein